MRHVRVRAVEGQWRTADDISVAIDRMAQQAANGGKEGDTTFAFSHQGTGLTVHCNNRDLLGAAPKLRRHCELRKYTQKAPLWCGLLVSPGDGAYRNCVVLDYPWQQDQELEKATEGLPRVEPARSLRHFKKVLKRFRQGKPDK